MAGKFQNGCVYPPRMMNADRAAEHYVRRLCPGPPY
jgi:hypothetical protein